MNSYLLFKSLHLIAVISWMAGLLYLPRIFVYHSENNNEIITSVFKTMERKLFYYIMTTFQSRFGPQEWLTPYTDKTLEEIPKQGKKNILVICPGFASDCVETLEEIAIQGKESFVDAGGENFDLIPCLNDNEDHINLLKNLVDSYLVRK